MIEELAGEEEGELSSKDIFLSLPLLSFDLNAFDVAIMYLMCSEQSIEYNYGTSKTV